MSDDTTTELDHLPGCPAERSETFRRKAPEARVATVTRCIDCGEQEVELADLPPLEPGTDEWREAWRTRPNRIHDALTREQRRDPKLNPLHNMATSWPPDDPPPVKPGGPNLY